MEKIQIFFQSRNSENFRMEINTEIPKTKNYKNQNN